MLGRFVESFISKIGEQLVDHVQNTMRSRETLDSLRRNLESLSARAYDIEEQIKNAGLSGKKKRKREVEKWLADVRSITELENEVESEGFISRFMGGGQAAKLNERVDKLVEQSRHFGELLLDVRETRGEALLTTSLVGKAFEENFERIWGLLVTDKVSSIGIYGMGGVGKTTLAKHINNRFIANTHECVFWVTVSQVFTIKVLQDEIARVVGVDLSDENNEDKRAARLHRALSQQKNSILILDDVWKYIDLKKVGDPLSVDGCRLVVTSRSLQVCRQIGCRVIEVETLGMDEAWNLFSETLGEETKLAPQVREIAESVAKKCGGLPLGIITLAGSMRGETAIHVWRNALEKLKDSVRVQDDTEDPVFEVLKYSFDRLNPDDKRPGRSVNGYSSLQLCFMYCSLYPEDYKIPKDELVRKFISEGLMYRRESRKAQVDQGYSILDKLVNVCLLESTRGHKHRDCVKMHDLVRAMALKITEGKTMVIAGHSVKKIPNEEEWTKDLEKVSLMRNSIWEIPPGMSPNCPKLSTLLLQNNRLQLIPDAFFSQMHGLCTLDLSGTLIKELPNSLSDLESLKALLLEDCRELEYVPYLGRLKALRELDLSGTAIKEVPQGIEELVNLKFLSIDVYRLEMFPAGLLLRFPHLQHLEFPPDIEVPIEEVGRLKQLEEFSGTVYSVRDFNRFFRSRQCQEYDTLYNIRIGPCPSGDHFRGYNLVTMDQYNFSKKEEKDESMLAQDIHRIEFAECEGLSNCLLDDFSRLNINPICLRSLDIGSCEGIECILNSEQLMMTPAEELQSRFSTLEVIELVCLSDFKGVIHRGEIGATILASPHPSRQAVFSSLRRLEIIDCRKMKKLGLPVSEFPNLEEIEVEDCPEIEEIIQVEADDEEEGRSSGEGREARRRFVTLPKLKKLELVDLPRLERICKATMICSSIETISLVLCPTLKKLPFDAPPPALKQIFLSNKDKEKEWWESLEWEHPTHSHLFQPLVRFEYGDLNYFKNI